MPTESPKKRKLPSHWIKLGQETDSTDMDIDEYFSSANSDASEMSWSPTDNTTFFSQGVQGTGQSPSPDEPGPLELW